MRNRLTVLSALLVFAVAGCGDDAFGGLSAPSSATSSTEATTTTTEATTTTTEATTTTAAPGLLELAAPICAGLAVEYAAAANRPMVQRVTLEGETEGYLVMRFEEDAPYANAVARLEALSLTEPSDQADLQRLIDALNEAESTNDAVLEDNANLVAWIRAMQNLEAVAGEIGLSGCADLTLPG